MKQKMKWLRGLLLVVFVVLSTISVSAVSLDLEKAGANKTDLIPLGIETATVNGQKVNVGTKVAVTYYVSSDAEWEDFQGYVTYDPTGLKLEKFSLTNSTSNAFVNTKVDGFVYYADYSFTNYFDFTTEKVLYIAEFTVLSGGDYTVENTWEVIDDKDSVSIVDGDFCDESRLSCRSETAVVQYTVTFKNYDGTVISTEKYNDGETVVVPTEIPVKPADKQYTYSFSGWDKEVAQTVNADATYTAVFTGTLNKYSVSVSYVNGTVTGCPTDAVDYGTSVTLKAKADEGYTFAGFYVGVTRVSTTSTYTFTVTENTDVVAKFTQNPVSELSVSVSGGTRLKVKLGSNGVETTQSTTYKNQNVRTGQYVTLTPTGNSGYDFLYWINDSGKIVAYSEAYTFMFTGKISLTAVYSYVSDGVVTFMSGYNQINSSMCYSSADEISLPTPYGKSGYTFKFWSIDGTTECTANDIYTASQNGNVTVKAVYELEEVYYNLKVNGGTIVSVDDDTTDAGNTTGSYRSINAIKVQANEAEEGKKFAYWEDQNGKILAYSD
ncbi:MAG: InlB B-repeat-containing protein, partial [Ruminococcus sp.]